MAEPQRDLTGLLLGIVFIGALIVAAFWILRPFLAATIWALTIVVVTWPLLLRMQARLWRSRALAITVMMVILLLLFVVPLTLAIGTIVANADEIAYRANGGTGLNFELRPARSNNLEAGMKWRTPAGAPARIEFNAAVFQTATQSEIVSQTNTGGRSTFQNAGVTRRRGLEMAASVQLPGHGLLALSSTTLDARYREGFASCSVAPCAVPNVFVPAGNRIPGVARTALAAELGWRPAQGWRGGVEIRYLSQVFADDRNTLAARAFTVVGTHAGYVADAGRWQVTTTARIDNLTGRKYAGSMIVNEGNGRYFEPAAGRSGVLSVTGRYAF